MPLFRGLSAFPITPADERGRVDTEALASLLQRLEAAGVDSIGLLGSTGTHAYLTRAEWRRAIEAAAECVGGRVPCRSRARGRHGMVQRDRRLPAATLPRPHARRAVRFCR